MIIEFSVQNFRSIYDKVTLSMMASKLTGKEATLDNIFYHENYPNIPLLKSAVIYGANASGKSNVLKAIQFFKYLIQDSTDYKFGEKIFIEPFRLLKDAPNEPSCFEMDFIAQDGVRYIYGCKINKEEVIEEYLSAFISRKETKLFVRRKGDKIQFSSSFKGEKKVLEDQLLKNNLLLSKAANSNYEQMQKVYTYFKSLNIYLHTMQGNLFSREKSFVDPYYKKNIADFLKVADTGIESFDVRKEDDIPTVKYSDALTVEERKLYLDNLSYKAEAIHYTTDDSEPKQQVRWDMSEESTGTLKLFGLAAPIIEFLNNGDTMIFDEINNSWHPHLSKFIIDLFHNKKTNPKNAQLIFTTHDATLMTKENFRRDQVWFTDKNDKGMTRLYSLSDFDKKEVRWDIPFDRWYLTGRFGAIPIITDYQLFSK